MASLAAAFDQLLILYLISASTPPILPLFRAGSLFSPCTHDRFSRPLFPWLSSQRGRRTLSHAHETDIPNSLAMLAASATRSLL
ncbi:hypothetical protein EI94DRAFT_453422 [Lactarius quietus]|nr:hypothetical protein EI94DRAFT_453422 [Lactarius quietus]